MKALKIEERWDTFPPTEEDYERLFRYERNRCLYRSLHEEVFGRRSKAFLSKEDPDEALYSKVNFCKLITNKTADHLFGEDSPMRPPSGNAALDRAIGAVWERSRLPVAEWEGAAMASYCGEAVIRVRYDGFETGGMKGSYIETVDPSRYFVEFDEKDARKAAKKCLAYVTEQENGTGITDHILHKEIHLKGRWKTQRWKLNGGAASALIGDSGWMDTYYPEGFLIWHIPNQRTDSYWGIDDYEDIVTLQDSLNNAMSRLERVLDKFSDPVLVAPDSEDETKDDPVALSRRVTSFLEMSPDMWDSLNCALGSARRMRNMKYFHGDPDALKDVPRYVEWGADLASRLAQIKQIIEFMMMLTETNPTVLGLETAGGVESGWALSIKMAGFKAKIRRRQQNWHYALQEAMYAALAIENRINGGPAPEKPDILWSSGLPVSQTEEIDNAVRMHTAGLASLETAVRRAQPDLTDEAVQEEIGRIKAEKEEARQQFLTEAAAGMGGAGEGGVE